MLSTLPGTCAKSKEDRGSFDHVILEQLEKAIAAKISTLAGTVAAETSVVAERAAAVKDAETDCNCKKGTQNQFIVAFKAAQKEQADGDAALIKATEAANVFRTQLEEAGELCEG